MILINIKRFPTKAIKAQMHSPAIFPIVGHIARDVGRHFTSSRLSSRRHHHLSNDTAAISRLCNKHLSTSTMPAPLTNPTASFLHDLESDFFPKSYPSFFDTPFLATPFSKQMEWMDDMRRQSYFPQTHIKREDDKHTLSMELPGVAFDDLHVEVEDERVLHISGEKKIKSESDDSSKKSEMKFDKKFSFGDTVDTKNIVANLKDGILRVTLPQLPKRKLPTRNIAIISSGEAA